MRRMKRNLAGVCSILILVTAANAQSIEMRWTTIAGGGGRMASGNGVIELNCTLGEPMAGTSVGGQYEVTCGFWAGMPAGCSLAGDLDSDGNVNLADLTQLLSNFGMTGGAVASDGDSDGDGDVDLADLTALLSNFGLSCA